jgi:phosphoribosylanthranilate isomerase
MSVRLRVPDGTPGLQARGHVRVKICGITRLEDALLAVELGADAIGFVLWERSPRHIYIEDAAAISRQLPAFVTRVGVAVNLPPDRAAESMRTAQLDVLQLHGDEAVEPYADVPGRLLKAMPLASDAEVETARALPPHVTVLVDAADREKRGGTGQRADWIRAARLARERPIVLAGGLTADNVREAVACVRPWAIDVSSGVEDAPGVKSARRMEELFGALHGSR